MASSGPAPRTRRLSIRIPRSVCGSATCWIPGSSTREITTGTRFTLPTSFPSDLVRDGYATTRPSRSSPRSGRYRMPLGGSRARTDRASERGGGLVSHKADAADLPDALHRAREVLHVVEGLAAPREIEAPSGEQVGSENVAHHERGLGTRSRARLIARPLMSTPTSSSQISIRCSD
jgi:hypothetical protein